MCAAIMTMMAAVADPVPTHDHGAMQAGSVAPDLLPVSTAHSFSALMANVDAVMHYGMTSARRDGDPDHDFASAMALSARDGKSDD